MENKRTKLKKMIETKEESTYLSYDVKTMITVFLLATVYPVGLILMFIWMKWNKWLKFLIVLPGLLTLIVPFFVLAIIGSVIMRVGTDLINSNEFGEMRRDMMNRRIEILEPREIEIRPTESKIPLYR